MTTRCIKKVSVTGKRCAFKAHMADDCMWFMCDNSDYTHFFSYKEVIEESK